jgi:hopene-associated glycosyltransferase HpnB
VPARDEGKMLPDSLPSLFAQDYPGAWRIILVDDHSTDGTGAIARKLGTDQNKTERLIIVPAPELPEGWSGKVAAMQAGVEKSSADYILFTDADIQHPKNSLRKLMARATENKLDLVSRMVKLNCNNVAEKLLIPAFVFFFMMLYPFRRVNDPRRYEAGAAGGVLLVKRQTLDACGGLAAIRSALIDDCSLAKVIKKRGAIEITLVDDMKSLRAYSSIGDTCRMIKRAAYTQLNYSLFLLIGTIIGMSILSLVPLLFLLVGEPLVAEIGLAACLIMFTLYMPTIRFYELPFVWSLTLPLAAVIYIGATIDSARLHWLGRGGQWKGRIQTGMS